MRSKSLDEQRQRRISSLIVRCTWRAIDNQEINRYVVAEIWHVVPEIVLAADTVLGERRVLDCSALLKFALDNLLSGLAGVRYIVFERNDPSVTVLSQPQSGEDC